VVDPEVLQIFIEEVESLLPAIRGGILVGLQSETAAAGELETSLLKIGTIKNAAFAIGFKELGVAAAKLESDFSLIVAERQALTEEDSRTLLDQISAIEALLLRERLNADDFPIDFNDFIEESFEKLCVTASSKKVEATNGQIPENLSAENNFKIAENDFETEEDTFEIDEEMLEIFALEAEDLLRSINVNLEILAQTPANREALLEIRRNAHTFKGSAGIVGLKKPSELAHRVEDLLDYMAEHEIAGNREIFEILLASTDCLSAMTSGEKSARLSTKIAEIYKDFDCLMNALAAPKVDVPAVETQPVEAKSPAVKTVSENEIEQNTDSNQKAQTQNSKSVVRVSLEKLDDLVKIVHGLVISRSVFERRLGELDRQIEELHHTTNRLQRSTAKLETNFEANMLVNESSRFKFQSLKFKLQNSKFEIADFNTSDDSPPEFDSLEFDRYTDFHQSARELAESASDAFAINTALDGLRGNLEMLFDSQRRLVEEMQDKLLRIRMVNFGTLSARLMRTARVTCEEENKQVELNIEGEELDIDTQVLDSLIEPLLHLLRNAVAHGIELPETRRLLGKPEKGAINVRIANEEMHVILTISDDGRGISAPALKSKAVQNGIISRERAASMTDEEAYELIFLPGLTTAEKLSQTSGRGVGMNIIKTAVERQQGTISIFSEAQKGTTFTLRLPMALAVTRALLVKAGEQTFAFPLGIVKQITEISGALLEKAKCENKLQFGSYKYELVHLNELLDLPFKASSRETERILLLNISDVPRALLVDEIIKPEEIVIKPLGSPLQNMPNLIGAAILGDGRIAPVLDLFYLFNQKVQSPKSKVQSPLEIQSSKSKVQSPFLEVQNPKSKIQNVLIVDDSPSVRHLTSNIIKNAGFGVAVAKDGLEALEILQASKELPDIILTDVEMPRMDGYELLTSLKRNAELQSIPVIMITSRAGEKHRRKALDLGVSEYLTKPFEDSILLGKIRTLTKVF
jgi:chemosensory pili system protein ChpA (sensor histidine kinase/response regulator)